MPPTEIRDRSPRAGFSLLGRRPPRYVPRHSTRVQPPAWTLTTAVPATAGDGPVVETVVEDAEELLHSVLRALEGVDAAPDRPTTADDRPSPELR